MRHSSSVLPTCQVDRGTQSRRTFALILAALISLAAPTLAVQPVFEPGGASFYDMPWPFDLRRDPDGTLALDTFPVGGNALLESYAEALGQT